MIYKLIIGILIILIILLTCILIKERLNEKQIIKNRIEEEYKKVEKQQKERIDNLKDKYDKDIEIIRKEFQSKQQEYDELFARNETFLKKEQEKINLILNQKEEIIDKELKNYKIQQENKIKKELENQKKISIDEYVAYIERLEKSKIDTNNKLEEIKNELEDYRLRRAAINEAIRREEEVENEINYHRIILSDMDKEDINYLLSIEEKIHNKDLLHKLIWSEYLQKPFNQMINNIFGSNVPKNVIYCIENYTTHKKYIGKTSAEVSKRWTEHIKSSLNIGGIKKQKIHEALFKHWDEYTFSILEVVTKETLNEKEKYYISFFETDKYGFNSKSGG